MFRIRQQHWFCIAAVCLVGSLLSIWSGEIPVAREEQPQPSALAGRPILRRLSDLPEASPLSEADRSDGIYIQAPAGVAGRMASPLNTTGRIIPRNHVSPAGFEQAAAVAIHPIQLTGQIEPIEASTETR